MNSRVSFSSYTWNSLNLIMKTDVITLLNRKKCFREGHSPRALVTYLTKSSFHMNNKKSISYNQHGTQFHLIKRDSAEMHPMAARESTKQKVQLSIAGGRNVPLGFFQVIVNLNSAPKIALLLEAAEEIRFILPSNHSHQAYDLVSASQLWEKNLPRRRCLHY